MSNDNDKRAFERVLKARVEHTLTQTFYGVLVGQVEPVATRAVPTMATNGVKHYFNPDFIMSLSKDHRGRECHPQKLVLGVQAHESEHDARRHHTRRGERDHVKWNIATDYAINIDLIDAGYSLPEGALIDPKYRGMSAEDIYRTRELDEEKARREQEQEQADSDDGEGEDDDESEPEAGDEGSDDSDGDEPEAGDEAGDDGESGSEDEGEAEGDDGDDADGDDGEPGSDGETEGDEGEGQDTSDDDGNGEGESDPDTSDGEATGEAAGEASETEGQGSGEPGNDAPEASPGDDEGVSGEPKSYGDPGGCGEVLDAGTEPAEVAEADAKWERVIRQAASLSKARGNLPGHVTREIERNDHPPQDWRETLRQWFDRGALKRESWSRPNRRFAGAGTYVPGSEKEGVNKIVFLIDTSGSMDDVALACIEAETRAALDDGVVDECVVVYGDTEVTRVDEFKSGDDLEFDPRGGGGTYLTPLFDHVRDNVEDPTLIVVFTDGYHEGFEFDPPCDVLFAYTGYPNEVRSHMENTPWGAAAIDVGSH